MTPFEKAKSEFGTDCLVNGKSMAHHFWNAAIEAAAELNDMQADRASKNDNRPEARGLAHAAVCIRGLAAEEK